MLPCLRKIDILLIFSWVMRHTQITGLKNLYKKHNRPDFPTIFPKIFQHAGYRNKGTQLLVFDREKGG